MLPDALAERTKGHDLAREATTNDRVDVDFSLATHNRTGKYFIGRDLIETPGLPVGDVYYWHFVRAMPPSGLSRRVIGRLQYLQIKGKTLGGVGRLIPARRSTRPLLHLDPFTVPTTRLRPWDAILCHDVGPITHPMLFDRDIARIYDRIYRSIERIGPHVVFVSEATRRAFDRCYPAANLASARVIYPAIRTDIGPEAGTPVAGLEGDFLLTVGSIGDRKNQARCIRAFARSGLAARNVRYVLCGGREPGYEQVAEIAAATPGVMLLPYVNDAELAWLYGAAKGFVLASLLEGFGMPVAEAIAREQVPLVSDESVLQEVAGAGALLVDPTDEESIATGMRRLADLTGEERARRLALLRGSIERFSLAAVQDQWRAAFAEFLRRTPD